jgi:Fe-S oxidoreductase
MIEQEVTMRVWVCTGCDFVEEAMPHDTETGNLSGEPCVHCMDGDATVEEATPEQRARAVPADPSSCHCELCKAEAARRKRQS